MNELKQATGFEAGLSGDDQIRVALQRMIERGGEAQMPDIYEALEARIRPQGFTLSKQGRASLRFSVNKVAVQASYVYPHDAGFGLAYYESECLLRDLCNAYAVAPFAGPEGVTGPRVDERMWRRSR